MSSAYITSPPLKLEGEFNTYTEIWNTSITNLTLAPGAAISGQRVFIDENNDGLNYVRSLVDGSAVDSDSFGFNLGQGDGRYTDGSILNKYVVRRVSASSFEVWKDGVLLQTITLPVAGTIRGLVISPSGKYILVGDKTNALLYLYQGS